MTSVQNPPAPRNDDHTARSTKRAGAPSKIGAAPEQAGAEFSSLLAASQRQLEGGRLAAGRLAAGKDDEDASDRSNSSLDFLADDRESDDGANADTPPPMPPAQSASQGQAGQPVATSASTSQTAPTPAGPEDSPDWLTLASLLPAGADDGTFEVLMPNHGKVDVSVNDMPDGVSYLLAPDDAMLADRLRSHEMELEALLRRRIRRSVRVVVL